MRGRVMESRTNLRRRLLRVDVVCRCEKAMHAEDNNGGVRLGLGLGLDRGFSCIRFQGPAATVLHKANYHRYHLLA
jgi:hypothetical protein